MAIYREYSLPLSATRTIIVKMETTKDINRIKVVLVEKKRTNKWLAEQLGKDPATVSKWCTNTAQPSLETLLEIAKVLEVDVKDLLHSTREGILPKKKDAVVSPEADAQATNEKENQTDGMLNFTDEGDEA